MEDAFILKEQCVEFHFCLFFSLSFSPRNGAIKNKSYCARITLKLNFIFPKFIKHAYLIIIFSINCSFLFRNK